MDNISTARRSWVMSLVKSKNTKPELVVRKFLFSYGFRYRIHNSKYPGKPDIILSKYRTVIFVHGCFWHGHRSKRCKLARMPKSNIDFWENKIYQNEMRDKRNRTALKKLGWKVVQIWECQLKDKSTLLNLIDIITS